MTAKRLGRGLSALIRETPDETAALESILFIPIDMVSPNPLQPRQDFNSAGAKKGLKQLADSIREKGIIQPITVRSKDGGYELIVGERRWRAAKVAGLTEISAHVVEVGGDVEMVEYALVENIQRENLNAVEEAEAYAVLSGTYRLSHGDIARAVGKSRVTISNSLRLLKLPSEIKGSLRKGEITAGHGRALLRLKTSRQMLTIWKRILDRHESVRATEELVSRLTSSPAPQGRRTRTVRMRKSPDIRKIEDDLITLLGTKVSVRPKSKGGVIEVVYYSHDDLGRLLDLFAEIRS